MSVRRARLRSAAGVCALALAAAWPGARAAAEDPPPLDDAKLAPTKAEEAKAIVPVLRAAAKSDHRRQAWYAAQRVLSADPKHAEAKDLAGAWRPEALVEGVLPERTFEAKRDAAYAKAGSAWAALSRVLTAEGRKPTEYAYVVERALAYGNRDADVVASLQAGDHAWAGTWGAVPKKGAWEKWIAPLGDAVTWPPEWDDDFLKAKAFWPEAKVARLWGWRVVTGLPAEEAWRVLGTLAALETWFVDRFGSVRKSPRDSRRAEEELVDLLLLPDATLYEKIGLVDLKNAAPEDRTRFRAATGSLDLWRRRLLVMQKHPTEPWIGDDANWLGHAGQALARLHLGPPSGGISGRGTWILDGVRGLCEGFVAKDTTGGDVDPARCRLLATARAMHRAGTLPTWDALLELDRRQADDLPRPRAKLAFAGSERDVEKADVVAAAATALVFAILRSDLEKGAKRLSTLIQETMKRDRMPDLDKALGWPKGRAHEEWKKTLEASEGSK